MEKEYRPRPHRARRRDGLSTRKVVLEAAGKVFAERGFAEATSKEICERAGTNGAAVNYHFGGKERLYEEVLVEAHRQMVSLEDLDEIISSDKTPEEKLQDFLGRMIRTISAAPELWGIKVFLRELAAPSPFVTRTMTTTVLPKANKLRALMQEITGLPMDSIGAQRATAFVAIPCIALIMFPDTLRSMLLPDTTADSKGLLEDMLVYALGGLRALGQVDRAKD